MILTTLYRYSKLQKYKRDNYLLLLNSLNKRVKFKEFSVTPYRVYSTDSLKKQNTVSLFQARIRKCMNKGKFHTALLQFENMKERNLTPSLKIYNHIIRILLFELDDKERAKEVYKEMKKHGYELEEDLKHIIEN